MAMAPAVGGAATALPPLSKPSPNGGGSMAPSPDRASEHPFEMPFSIMQTMQADLNWLREELRLERVERRAEVGTLSADIAQLRDTLKQGEQKQKADHNDLAAALKALQVKEDEDWRSTRTKIEAQLALCTRETEHLSLAKRAEGMRRDLEALQVNLDHTLSELKTQIHQNSEGDCAFAQEMKAEVASQRAELERSHHKTLLFEETVLVQLRMAGCLLRAAGTAERRAASAVLTVGPQEAKVMDRTAPLETVGKS